mmetsp:Transcript_18440/g.37755  ORF Transcript_18440/g.37755 Transcript_18440/m.37755 type:complete len:280 (+) Transcript_18440:49-888(+)
MSGFALDADTLAVFLGVVTLIGSVIAYFSQQAKDKRDEEAADKKKEEEIDRQQALERVRLQMSVFIGPIHRLYKTQTTLIANYFQHSGHGMNHMMDAMTAKGSAYWLHLFADDFIQGFIDDPNSFEAECYRNFISRRLKPIYTRIRELVLANGSDLADMPSQEEWLAKYDKESVTSPILGSLNTNVIFDTFSAWTVEFDDIIESWSQSDFRRMQPTIVVNWPICNELVDLLYDNAKMKEATYNKHVKVHKNVIDTDMKNQLARSNKDSLRPIYKEYLTP